MWALALIVIGVLCAVSAVLVVVTGIAAKRQAWVQYRVFAWSGAIVLDLAAWAIVLVICVVLMLS